MGLSLFLAKVFAVYLLIFGFALVVNKKSLINNFRAMFAERGVMYLSSIMTLILGILLVLSHNEWVPSWPVIITILSWWVFIKGLVRVVWPRVDDYFMKWLDHDSWLMSSAIICIGLGGYLAYVGWW